MLQHGQQNSKSGRICQVLYIIKLVPFAAAVTPAQRVPANHENVHEHRDAVPQHAHFGRRRMPPAHRYLDGLQAMVPRQVQQLRIEPEAFDALLLELRAATNMPPGLYPRDYAHGARHATTTNLPGNLRLLDFVGIDRYALGFTLHPTQALDGDSA